MKKLRAVQERMNSESIPNDLRGVGQSPLLTELPPCPYLLVDGVEANAIHSIQEMFQVRLSHQDHFLILESAVTESYKHQGLRLWYAARYLLSQHAHLRLQLSERQLLREALEANLDQTAFVHPDTLRRGPLEAKLPQPGSLSLSPLHQLALAQIGYPVQAIEQDLILNHGDPLFHHEVKKIETQAAAS